MARMYSRARGKSGSKKPVGKSSYSWVSYKPKEIEMLIVKMAKEGKSAAQIGLVMRDSYGVPNVRGILKKKISELLAEKKLLPELPEDVLALIKRDILIMKHMAANKQDMAAKRGKLITESKINRLVKYYKAKGRIPETWKFNPENAGMFVE
jgi:small subunit ribosomal protein S15